MNFKEKEAKDRQYLLSEKIFESGDMRETRQAFADALIELGKKNPDVVVLGGDVSGSVKTNVFRDAFPERFFSVGIAEQDMMGVAAGLAAAGKIPIASAYGEFAAGRPFDQIRQSIAYSEMNVKICASHCGISVGPDGATHQSLEDVGLMRLLPNMTVVTPCDYNQTYKAIMKCVETEGPFYVRFYRDKTPNFTNADSDFELGKAEILREGKDVTLAASGLLVWEALKAARELAKEGIEAKVMNIHTIKPIDEEALVRAAEETNLVITCEDHQKQSGLYGAAAEVLSRLRPTQMDYVAVEDTFGESGTMEELMRKYKINDEEIIRKVKKHLKK